MNPHWREPEDETRGENVRRGIRALALRRSGLAGPFAGVLSRPQVLDRMRRRHFPAGVDLSPTQLEEYGRCGFRYFLTEDAQGGISGSGRHGSASGAAAAGSHDSGPLLAGSVSVPLRGSRRQVSDGMAGILGEELERLRQARPTAGGLLWEQLQTGLMDGADGPGRVGVADPFPGGGAGEGAPTRSSIPSRPPWDPCFWAGFRVAVKLREETGPPVRLKGLPDRIERTSEGYRVVLYAAGRQERLRRIREGWGYRLPLSLLLVHSLVGKATSGGFYHVSPPGHLQWRPLGKRGRPASRGELDRLMGSYQEKALLAARGIHDGRFPVTTLKSASAGCSHCAYSRVCRRDEALAGGTPA